MEMVGEIVTDESRALDGDKRTAGVTLGDIRGGIRDAVIAGRDANVTIGQRIVNVITSSAAERRAQRNRRAMLELVRTTWIRGVLDQSLHGAAMIQLGMEERAEAVEYSWDIVLQTTDHPHRELPPDKALVDVFDEMNGALLILGEPGSGKTTMLLELARDTIARAEDDPLQPIPVVFNLSSWAEKRPSVDEWLIGELNTKYHIPTRIACPWVENDDLLLLLDGLDEVKTEHRGACIEAINGFRREHGLAPIVICSRTADYEALTNRLRLQGAVVLQPLTSEQIDQYLAGAGTDSLAVRRALRRDSALRELAQSPLMLSIMALTYRDLSVKAISAPGAERRKRLFDAYVERMLRRRGADKRYPVKQVAHWLAWLARNMSQHAQTEFFIEGMQPSWLSSRTESLLYNVGIRLVGALTFVLAYVMGCVLGCALGGGVSDVLTVGLAFGLVSGLAFVLASVLAVGLPAGLTVGLSAGLTVVLTGAFLGSGGGLIAGLVFGLPAGLAGVSVADRGGIRTAEMLSWSWKKALGGGVVGLAAGLAGGLVFELILGQVVKLADVLTITLPVGLAFMLAWGVSRSEAVESRIVPNQGIRRSARNAIWVGWTAVLASVLFGVPIGILEDALSKSLAFGLFIGLPIGLSAGLVVGGSAYIQNRVLCFVLCRNGHIPRNLACFLDYAAERILLRKVGGGYIFVHRLLLDHFATLED